VIEHLAWYIVRLAETECTAVRSEAIVRTDQHGHGRRVEKRDLGEIDDDNAGQRCEHLLQLLTPGKIKLPSDADDERVTLPHHGEPRTVRHTDSLPHQSPSGRRCLGFRESTATAQSGSALAGAGIGRLRVAGLLLDSAVLPVNSYRRRIRTLPRFRRGLHGLLLVTALEKYGSRHRCSGPRESHGGMQAKRRLDSVHTRGDAATSAGPARWRWPISPQASRRP
jgi:hypothetical protein